MDILNQDSGFSIIETLVTILIVGILIIIVSIFMETIFSNPRLFLKSKALYLGQEEINYVINHSAYTDTSYFNNKANLFVNRQITELDKVYKINVSVMKADEEILTLSRVQSK